MPSEPYACQGVMGSPCPAGAMLTGGRGGRKRCQDCSVAQKKAAIAEWNRVYRSERKKEEEHEKAEAADGFDAEILSPIVATRYLDQVINTVR